MLRNLVQGGHSSSHGEALHASLHIKCEALQQLLCALNRFYYASFTPSLLRKLCTISCTSFTQRTNELESSHIIVVHIITMHLDPHCFCAPMSKLYYTLHLQHQLCNVFVHWKCSNDANNKVLRIQIQLVSFSLITKLERSN